MTPSQLRSKLRSKHRVLRLARISLLCIVVSLCGACASNSGYTATATPLYRVETLVSGGPLHGAKGITFGPDGYLYVCSVYAQSIYRVNVQTGAVTVAVGPPHGTSDDVAFAPDGSMAWSALPDGEIRARQPDGEPYVLADKLPLINPLNYTADGRLFAAQIGIDRFLEIDVSGTEKPRLVARGIGHLNSFQITADDQLYGPLAGLEQLAQIDLASGDITVIADSSGMLSAVSLNSTGQIYAVGWISGELLRFDIDADTGVGTAVLVAQLEPPLDNLAIDADDMIYVSQPATGTIVKVDPASGAQTTVVPGNLGIPGGLAITMHKGRETLIVADDFGFRHVDTQTGEVYATIDLTEFMDPLAATAAAVNADVIVLSDVSRARVYMVDRTTNQTVHKWKNIDTPYGLVLTASGEPIVAEYASGTLIQLSTTDRKSRQIIATGLDGPVGLAWAGPDALYVSETRSGAITRIDINTGAKVLVTGGLDRPEGLAVLADGHLTVVEVGARRVIEIDPDHGTRVVLADALPVGAVTPLHPAPVHTPSGIVAGSDGSLYVSSDEDHSILRLVR